MTSLKSPECERSPERSPESTRCLEKVLEGRVLRPAPAPSCPGGWRAGMWSLRVLGPETGVYY